MSRVRGQVAPTTLPSLKLAPQLLQDGFLFWEGAGRELRVDELAVGLDLEAAPVGGYEGHPRYPLLELPEDLGRQTDGLRFIVSSGTVGQHEFHRRLLVWCW